MGRARVEKLMADLRAIHGVTGEARGRVEFEQGMKPADRINALLWALNPVDETRATLDAIDGAVRAQQNDAGEIEDGGEDSWDAIFGGYDQFVSDRPYLQE